MIGPSINVPIEPKPLTKPIIADAQFRPSISPSSLGNDPHKMISGPQFKIPISIIITELTNKPALAVAINKINPIADKNVPTVDPSKHLSLKYL